MNKKVALEQILEKAEKYAKENEKNEVKSAKIVYKSGKPARLVLE